MRYILFTTTTCPNCPAMKQFIADKMTLPGEAIDENHEDFYTKAKDLNVMNVPTVVIFNDNNQEVLRSSEENEITKFLQNNA